MADDENVFTCKYGCGFKSEFYSEVLLHETQCTWKPRETDVVETNESSNS